MSRLSDFQLYFWLIALIIGGFIYYKCKKMSDHVFNHYLYFVSLLALISRDLSLMMLGINPLSRIYMIFGGLCILSQGWLVFGTLALIHKTSPAQEQNNERTQLAEDIETIKVYFQDPSSPKITFMIWNVAALILFVLSLTDYSKDSNPFGALLIIVFYFATAWTLSKTNRANLLPEAASRLDILVTGFIVLGIIDTIALGLAEYFMRYFFILQSAFYLFEAMNIHNFSRMFNYNERISFEEFEQPRDTVNLDVSQRQEQASPSVQELKASGRHDDQDEDKQENDGHSP